MERKIVDDFLKWRRDSNRRVFCLYGKKQVGKTYSALEFGKKYFKNIAYFNVCDNHELITVLNMEKNLDKLILKLNLICGESIFKDDTLIIFDNCNDTSFLKNTRIFNNTDYYVMVISSNYDMIIKSGIEEIYYRPMHIMTFEEFLLNSDKAQLVDFIKDSYDTMKPMPFHQMAIDAYNDYLIVGGYPEAVDTFHKTNDFLLVETIKTKIINIVENSIRTDNYDRSMEILHSIPSQLIKENKKFQYGVIKKGARSKDYDSTINILVNNKIVDCSYRLSDVKSPLSSNKDLDSFKLYESDSGLLYTKLNMNRNRLLTDNDIRRTLIENNLANTLINNGFSLYYYQSEGKAELSMVIQNREGKIIPIEIVDKRLTKAKSLSLFMSKYNVPEGLKITDDNLSKKKGIIYIPVYSIFYIK